MSLDEKNLNQSILKAIEIVEFLSQQEDGMGVSELSRSLAIHKSSVFRVLNTLAFKGMVEKDRQTQRYKLSYKILEISNNLLQNVQVRNIAVPYLKPLLYQYHEVVHLTILYNFRMVYIDKLENPDSAIMYSQIGRSVPVYSTAVGKAMLAFMSEEDADLIIDNVTFEQRTPNTIADKKVFKEHLQQVRLQKYACDNEENEVGIRAVAAPILNYLGKSIAAFSVTGPATRMTPEKINRIREGVLEVFYEISKRFGYGGS